MTSAMTRNSYTEQSFGEPEQDANTALTELDKGLRSVRVGEQCEAIVRFPRLFEKYPFPILINSALLKLAEVFRLGTNFLRSCVFRVCQQSEKHLDKILNVDEFVKRIFSVMHSNDPVARALTLRTLGSIAIIIPERKSVHHSIRDSLDSHDFVELEAAIYAAAKFAAQSRTFAINMCSKISDMIQGLAYPADIKLKLIPILQYMHHDAQTSAMVRHLCMGLLPTYPSENFVSVILHTLTLLASATLVEMPQQIDLLLDYLKKDPRRGIQHQALKDLSILAEEGRGAHLWTPDNLDSLLDFLLQTEHKQLQQKALQVLCKLAKSQAALCFVAQTELKLQQVFSQCCYSSTTAIAAQATELLVHLATNNRDTIPDLCQEAAVAVDSLVLNMCCDNPGRELKVVLASAVQLCRSNADVAATMVDSLLRIADSANGKTLVLLCETLAAMGDSQPSLLVSTIPEVTGLLARLSSQGEAPEGTRAAVLLCVVLCQVHLLYGWTKASVETIELAAVNVNPWAAYKIARAAVRYGHHLLASSVLDRLVQCACTENLHFWLQGLHHFTRAESCLSGKNLADHWSVIQNISQSVNLHLRGLSSLKASSNQNGGFSFQCEFIRLRTEFLIAASQLLQACKSMLTAPPPAIAHAVAIATRDELQRCGRITQQLRKSVKELKSVSEAFGNLYQSSFDADPDTLANLQIQQQMALLLAYAVESTALRSSQLGTMTEDESSGFSIPKPSEGSCLSVRTMSLRSQEVGLLVQKFREEHSELRLINHLHTQLIAEVVRSVLDVPLCFPRFFFQTLQTTNIKLAVTPQPRVAGEPVTTTMGAQLAVKVEGIVQAGRQLFRRVKAVQVTLNCQQTGSIALSPDGKPLEGSSVLTQTVEPHNDYFSAQFLLSFGAAGLHHVLIDTAILDHDRALWHAGPKAQLSVKTFEESGSSKSSAAAASTAGRSTSTATSARP